MFDTDMSNLGEVYESIDSMIEKIRLGYKCQGK